MPKVVDHDARRAEIFAGCLPLFAARGYAAVGMRDVARELGLSTGALYHYFSGKDDLYAQLFAWVAQRDVDRAVGDIPAQATREQRLDTLFAFVAAAESELQQVLFLAMDFHRHGGDPAALAAATATYREAIAGQLGVDGGSAAFAAILGLVMHRLLEPTAADPAAVRALLRQPG